MDFNYIKETVANSGLSLPCTAHNESGEFVVIEKSGSAFRLTTLQSNNWLRINEYYPDGTITETFER